MCQLVIQTYHFYRYASTEDRNSNIEAFFEEIKIVSARQCPSVHPVSVVEGSQAWRWEAWEPRDSTYNMHLRKSQPENHRHVVQYAFNLLPGRKSERLPCHPCSAWQAPCERAVHLIYPSAPLSFSATSSATAVSFTIEFVQLQ